MTTSFWEKPLAELNPQEWEKLCDGCGLCCLHKIEDEDTEELFYTNVTCRYLDAEACKCSDYVQRKRNVPDCLELQNMSMAEFEWLPVTCAYRLRANEQPLFNWHYLLSGNKETVHSEGISVKNRVISEDYVHPDALHEHVVQWVNE